MGVLMFKSKFLISLILIVIFLPYSSFGQEDLDTAINKLAEKITLHMAKKQKTKIAVIPFQDLKTDIVTTLGKYIAEELTTALFNSGKFHIIERNLLNKVLEELKLSQTGAVNPSSAKELGKITGVDAVVTGTIQDLINRVAVNCRLIETETGNIFAAASEKILKDKSIAALLNEIIETNKEIEKPKDKKDKHLEGPFEYDASKYFIENVGWRWIQLEFLSFIVGDTLLLKAFFVYTAEDALNNIVYFTFPKIVDDQGNTYLPIKVTGDYKADRWKKGQYIARVPIKGRLPIFFEFPMIPRTIKKIWFSINDKSVEIDWQEVWNNPSK